MKAALKLTAISLYNKTLNARANVGAKRIATAHKGCYTQTNAYNNLCSSSSSSVVVVTACGGNSTRVIFMQNQQVKANQTNAERERERQGGERAPLCKSYRTSFV